MQLEGSPAPHDPETMATLAEQIIAEAGWKKK
jgi:hypothetical protein